MRTATISAMMSSTILINLELQGRSVNATGAVAADWLTDGLPFSVPKLRCAPFLCLALLGGCSRAAPARISTVDDAAPATPSPAPSPTLASSAPVPSSSVLAAAPTTPTYPTHDAPVCTRTERTFLECHVRARGAATVARLCGPANGPAGARYLAFVYGPPTRTETEIAVPAASFGETARYGRYTRPLVTMLAVGFSDASRRFELTQSDVEDIQPPERTAELVQYDGDGEALRLPCAPLPKQSLIALEAWFPPPPEPWVGGPLW